MLLVVCIGCAQIYMENIEVRKELQAKHREGLWLADWRGHGVQQGEIVLFPFAADPRISIDWPHGYQQGWFVSDARTLLVRSRSGELSVVDEQGKVTLTRQGFPNIRYATISSDRQRLAFTKGWMPHCSSIPCVWHYEYFWAEMKSPVNHLLEVSEEHGSSDVLSFSPDGRYLAVGIGGEVRIYDLDKSTFSVIGAGMDPTWSPNGDNVAFRTLEGRAILHHFKSGHRVEFLRGRRILSRLDWSPDSKYILFSEPHKGFLYGTTRLAVARVSDESTEVILEPAMGDTNYTFGWLYYRNQ